jgi:LPXTG-motif cell wall-anchored protein
MACGFLQSGLRVFDIRDPLHAREVAYFNPPLPATAENSNDYGSWDQPVFVPERRELWFTSSESGFYVGRLSAAAWPEATPAPAPQAAPPAPAPAPAAGVEQPPAVASADGALPATGGRAPLGLLMAGLLLGAALAALVRRSRPRCEG